MSWGAVIVGGVSLGTKLVARGVAKKKARKERKKAEAEIAARTEKQKQQLQLGSDAAVRAEKDLGNVYEGATSIDPEAAQARDDSERATASAIDKATRAGASSTEIMNMVSGLTGQGQQRAKGISAESHNRRMQAMVAAKGQGVRAAAAGLAGVEGQLALEDKGFNMTEMKNQQINQAAQQNYEAVSGMVDDAAGMAMMGVSKIGAGKGIKTDPFGGKSPGLGTTTAYKPPSLNSSSRNMNIDPIMQYAGSFNSKRRVYGN